MAAYVGATILIAFDITIKNRGTLASRGWTVIVSGMEILIWDVIVYIKRMREWNTREEQDNE